MQAVGSTWLREHFQLSAVAASHESFIGGRRQRTTNADGRVEEIFSRNYWPGDRVLDHVAFALKYDDLNLDLLSQVFHRFTAKEVDAYIAAAPTGKYRRKIGFLYEVLTAKKLSCPVSGNFVPVLDPKRYFVGKEVRNSRWRVRDNLPGTGGFCPIVRKTDFIARQLTRDWPSEIRRLTQQVVPALLTRAVRYLYLKETKASFEIEHEPVSRSKEERFVNVLMHVGTSDSSTLLDEDRLTSLQNLVVDPRYAETGFRHRQNYVGETLPGLREKVHYVCPPPPLVRTLLAGLRTFRLRSDGLPPAVRAAVISFEFVYTHPFEDGNGRLHRLLLHESLATDGFVDAGVVLPFSAVMLRARHDYDRALESFSQIIMTRVQYRLDESGHLTIDNLPEIEGAWRFPDLTQQVEYVLGLIETTVTKDLPAEIDVLQRLDAAKQGITDVVDLPGRKLNLLLRLLHQNRGTLSKAKRDSEFAELSNAEIRRIEAAFQAAFAI